MFPTPREDAPTNRTDAWSRQLPDQPLEYLAAWLVRRLAGSDSRSVLVVGPGEGRDVRALDGPGRTVLAMDIARQDGLRGRLVLADAEGGWPFGDARFDRVVLCEILEHLWGDVAALREARRVLTDDGLLVVAVPFHADGPEYHARVHTPRTIRRLIRHAGFEVEEYVERGAAVRHIDWILRWRGFRRLLARVGVAFDPALANRRLAESEYGRGLGGGHRGSNASLASLGTSRSRHWGCFLSARKAEAPDFRRFQIDTFQNQWKSF
ncbi:MAG: class I SAM-dependent methyltransferase [Planctomycetes bacterium]|nr:class I SAM-dependent methyltransferase [Planctomycetota bacterium]